MSKGEKNRHERVREGGGSGEHVEENTRADLRVDAIDWVDPSQMPNVSCKGRA
jgi:hypothetical protein